MRSTVEEVVQDVCETFNISAMNLLWRKFDITFDYIRISYSGIKTADGMGSTIMLRVRKNAAEENKKIVISKYETGPSQICW